MWRWLVILAVLNVTVFAASHDEADILHNSKAVQSGAKTCNGDEISLIRRMHPDFLVHKRDQTLREGVRTTKHSLIGCIDCHANTDASGAFIPVNAENQFCAQCHAQVGVREDCFICHRTTPEAQ